MSFAFSYEVPSNPQVYAAVKAEIGPSAPAGMIAQLVIQTQTGLQHIMVWDSSDHWERFRSTRVEPAVAKVLAAAGIQAAPAAPAITPLQLVDIWTPCATSAEQPYT